MPRLHGHFLRRCQVAQHAVRQRPAAVGMGVAYQGDAPRKTIGTWSKAIGKPWENHGKPWETIGKPIGNYVEHGTSPPKKVILPAEYMALHRQFNRNRMVLKHQLPFQLWRCS